MIALYLTLAFGADTPKLPPASPPAKQAEAPKKEAPAKSSFLKRKHDVAIKPKTADDDAPPVVPERNIPKPEGESKEPTSATDKDLIRQLGKDLDVEDQTDPLLRAGQRMRAVEEQMAKAEVSGVTEALETKIVADLKELLKRAKNRKPNSKKKNDPKDQDQNEQEKQQQEEEMQAAKMRRMQQQQSAPQPRDAAAEARAGRATKEELSKMREERDVWGHLPELERQLLNDTHKEAKLPEYRAALDKYYQRIAELSSGKEK